MPEPQIVIGRLKGVQEVLRDARQFPWIDREALAGFISQAIEEITRLQAPTALSEHRIRDEITWLSAHGHHERARVLAGWIGVDLEARS